MSSQQGQPDGTCIKRSCFFIEIFNHFNNIRLVIQIIVQDMTKMFDFVRTLQLWVQKRIVGRKLQDLELLKQISCVLLALKIKPWLDVYELQVLNIIISQCRGTWCQQNNVISISKSTNKRRTPITTNTTVRQFNYKPVQVYSKQN